MTWSRGSVWIASACLAVAAVMVFLKKPGISPSSAEPLPYPVSQKSHTQTKLKTRPVASPPRVPLAALPKPMSSPHPPNSVEGQAWCAERVAALQDLAWFDDVDSLQKILAELRNPLPEIRAAAIAATRAYGSRDAIPYLTAKAAETGDPLEQKALTDLVEHLNLPTLIEQLESESGD